MKIGVLGKGVVGTAVYEGVRYLGHEASFFDPAYADSKFEDILDTDVVFIAVPTDQAADGSCDTSIVESVIKELSDNGYKGLAAIKSTIEPGTCRKLQAQWPNVKLCSVPEFLRARSALADFLYNHDMLVIGSDRPEDYAIIREVHGNLPERVAEVNPTEAELIKYFNNVHHAMSVTFANIMYEVSKALDSNYDRIFDTITQRACFNPAYLRCNENIRGFGGHCLPKDTSAYDYLIKKLGMPYKLIETVLSDNREFTK